MNPFALATLKTPAGPKAAIFIGDQYYLLSDLQPLMPNVTTKDLFEHWSRAFPTLEQLVQDFWDGRLGKITGVSAQSAELLPPVFYPNKLVAAGANYVGHLKEMGLDAVTKWDPIPIFTKPPTTALVGPGNTVQIPKMTKNFDWELELTVVIGKRVKDATPDEALQAIAGYTICLDMSCRDLTKVDLPIPIDMTRTKMQDTLAPCGPHIVPAQFVADVDHLRLRLFVNGEKMQDGFTSDMIYKCHEIVSAISQVMTLEPGDLVLTGTLEGCAAHRGNRWLQPGDQIRAEIECIGELNVSMRED